MKIRSDGNYIISWFTVFTKLYNAVHVYYLGYQILPNLKQNAISLEL